MTKLLSEHAENLLSEIDKRKSIVDPVFKFIPRAPDRHGVKLRFHRCLDYVHFVVGLTNQLIIFLTNDENKLVTPSHNGRRHGLLTI